MRLATFWQLCRFSAIGIIAAAIHYWVVIGLVELSHLQALQANFCGFASAFGASYFGHRHWTFSSQNTSSISFFRFLGVALLGFMLNQLLFYLLLRHSPLPYFIALGIVLVIVAMMTYVLSRQWAFNTQ